MKKIKIVMTCQLPDSEVEIVFRNMAEGYPEYSVSGKYEKEQDGMQRFEWDGVLLEWGSEDEFIRLTHHAEGLYENTSAEYVHVEVCLDGKWYGC